MEKLVRTTTGIPGMDTLLDGGLPSRTITLLSGSCGSGKSTFAMQFLHYGAKYCNEPGVYVTLEEDPDSLIRNMSMFGWDLEGLIRQKKLLVIKPDVYKFDSIKQIIGNAIEKIRAKRLVVDSYSVLLTYFKDPYEIRQGLVQLDRAIRKMNCTAVVISDTLDNSPSLSTTGLEEFIVDGLIVLHMVKDEHNPYEYAMRGLTVRKMRATKHPLDLYKFEITAQGIELAGRAHHAKLPPKAMEKDGAKEKPKRKKSFSHMKQKKVQLAAKSFLPVSSLKKGGMHFGNI